MRIIFIILVGLFFVSSAAAQVEQVDKAILHIVTKGISKYKIAPFSGHKLIKRVEARKSLAEAIVVAGEKYDVPVMLLVAIAYRENSFGSKKKGALGEESTFQIIPKVARFIRRGSFPWSDIKEEQCTLKTIEGSALCAAALLRIHQERCKTYKGALMLYVSGRTCRTDTARLRWLQRDRLGIAAYLERKFLEKKEDGPNRSD